MKKIIKIQVFGLFGDTDHEIKIDASKEFAIVYGPNGVGKTKVLEIAKYVSAGNTVELKNIDFKKAVLHYSNQTQLIAEKSTEISDEIISRDLEFINYTHIDLKDSKNNSFLNDSDSIRLLNWIENNTSWEHLEGDYWVDKRDNEQITSNTLLARYRHQFNRISRADHSYRKLKRDISIGKSRKEYIDFQNNFSSDQIYLIDTQRLRSKIEKEQFGFDRAEKNDTKTRIQLLSDQMKDLISRAQTVHSNISQILDRNFPSEVLTYRSEHSEQDIREIYDEQGGFRSRLARIINDEDISNTIELPKDRLNTWQINFLDRYLQDADKKLDPFKKIIEKIELLENIINSRLNHKELKISSKQGLQVTKKKTGENIPLSSLSSGEQHEIILIFDLLFNVPENCLVLIDEPEISLHVAWQRKFIPDVLNVSSVANFRFIIATHSPQIMGTYIDEAQRLGSPEDPWDSEVE